MVLTTPTLPRLGVRQLPALEKPEEFLSQRQRTVRPQLFCGAPVSASSPVLVLTSIGYFSDIKEDEKF